MIVLDLTFCIAYAIISDRNNAQMICFYQIGHGCANTHGLRRELCLPDSIPASTISRLSRLQANIKEVVTIMKQYEIWVAYLPTIHGSHVQGGCRPVIVVSNDMANTHSPVITIVPLTSNLHKNPLPTHVALSVDGLPVTSIALCEQVTAVDKPLLSRRIGSVDKESTRDALNRALAVQFGMAV